MLFTFLESRTARERRIRRARALPHRVRMERKLEDALDLLEDIRAGLVARLDELHGDPDLEPYLAGHNIESVDHDRDRWLTTNIGNDDREAADDDEDGGDTEPDLAGFVKQVTPAWMRREAPGQYVHVYIDAEDDGGDDLGHDSDTEEVCEDEGAQCEGGGS